MEFIPIFGTWNGGDPLPSLTTVKFDGEEHSEYMKFLNFMDDVMEVEEFLIKNEKHVRSYDAHKTIDLADLAQDIVDSFLSFKEVFHVVEPNYDLDRFFIPLDEKTLLLADLPLKKIKKALIKDTHPKKYLHASLRIYAIEVTSNVYIITGGAIKLSDRMEDHEATKEQLFNLKKVRALLSDEEYISDVEGFTDLFTQQNDHE